MPGIPSPTSDRFRAALLGFIQQLMPNLPYYGRYRYTVVTAAAPTPPSMTYTISGTPADPLIAKLLPPLANITMTPGNVWGFSIPVPGSVVVVGFMNGDPSLPEVIAMDPTTPPTAVYVGATMTSGLPLVLAPPLITALGAIGTGFGAIGTWAGAFTTALGAADFAAFATAMGAPTMTLSSAMTTAANAMTTAASAVATAIVKGL